MMSEKSEEKSLYWSIVGADSNTNAGVGRLLAVIVAFIVVGGCVVWLLS
jgi:hypothetical protein